ncbi:hypothetical protein D3C78_952140 [compost metagenome]
MADIVMCIDIGEVRSSETALTRSQKNGSPAPVRKIELDSASLKSLRSDVAITSKAFE